MSVRISQCAHIFRHFYSQIFGRGPELAFVYQPALPNSFRSRGGSSFLELLRDGLLWNTPKKRKSLERRMTERFGSKTWGSRKTLQVNKRIRVDEKTGEFFELNRLAPNKFKQIMEETKAIQAKMKNAFGFAKPIDREVSISYKNDKTEKVMDPSKLVVEMEKERPAFFSKNLVQKARTSSAAISNTTVRPSGLG